MKGKRRVIIKDNIGYKYDISLASITNHKGISFVDKRNTFALDNIRLWLIVNNKKLKLYKNNKYIGATEKLTFKCLKCGEKFNMCWNDIYHNHGCAYCRGLLVGKYNNFSYKNPDMASEWDYRKNNITPKDVTYGSHYKAWWICSKCGFEWQSSVNDRSTGYGCKNCSDINIESRIATELKIYCKNNYSAILEYRIFRNPGTNYYLPFDIYIPNGIFIEIHGWQHYKINPRFHKTLDEFEYQRKKDRMKRKYARKNGIYIEIDLRKIQSVKQAINYVNKRIGIIR